MTDDLLKDRYFKVVVIVSRPERSIVYSVKNGLTAEEATELCTQTIIDVQNGLYIPVIEGRQPHVINPAYIMEIAVEGWMI